MELPSELRLKIYSLIHENPRITFQHEAHLDHDEATLKAEPHITRISFKSQDPGVPDYLYIVHEEYDWRYLLTCRTVYQEAQHLLPHVLQLRILVYHLDVQHIPLAVRSRYFPHIPILTIIGQFPVYDTFFDGSQLAGLRKLYVQNDGAGTINQQFDCGLPPPAHLIARIRGASDREYIEQSLHKIQVSKLNWWKADKSTWLQSVLVEDRPPNLQLIISQDVRLRFYGPVLGPKNPVYISLVSSPGFPRFVTA